MVNTSQIYFSALFVLVAFVRTLSARSQCLPPSPSWHLTLSGLVLNVQFPGALQALFPDRLLLEHLVLLSFTRSLVLSVASCNVTSFTARACEDLSSVSIINEEYNFAVHVSSTMAGLMLSRHRSLFLGSLPAGCTRGYASCVHRESSVFSSKRTSTCCGRTAGAPAPLTPTPRAARVGRCLQSSTALVVVLQNDFMSLDFTNIAPQHPSSCSSHVR